MLSKDEAKTKNVFKTINAMDSADAINSYIAGDTREDVLDAARLQIEILANQGTGDGGTVGTDKETVERQGDGSHSALAKQGEQTGPITQQTSEFKGPGVQGTKSDTETRRRGDGEPDKETVGQGDKGSPLPIGKRAEGEGAHTGPLAGQDIIEALDDEALKKARAIAVKDAAAGDPITKTVAEVRRSKGIVTCEDVLEKQRREGKIV
jgi:hypothetical protein